jgi:phosphatidylglycerophosphate synthase
VADTANRRPIRQRSAAWARWAARRLAEEHASPDLISAASAAASTLAGGLLLIAGGSQPIWLRAPLFLLAAGFIQLRLACNLLDGMVAVEHGRGSSAGPIWNELPDRYSDVVVLACAGYAAREGGISFAVAAGWICAILALATAYVRELGRGLGFPADFSGPFAKQQRMAALTLACAISAVEPLWGWRGPALMIALVVIAAGTALTAGRRTLTLARRLAARAREQQAGQEGSP